jgi:hypothetical protein
MRLERGPRSKRLHFTIVQGEFSMSTFVFAWQGRKMATLTLFALLLFPLVFSNAQAQVQGCSKQISGDAFSVQKGRDDNHAVLLQPELKLSNCFVGGKEQDLSVSFYAHVASKICASDELRSGSKMDFGQASDLYIEWNDHSDSNMEVDDYSATLTGTDKKFLELQGKLSSGKFKGYRFKLRFDNFEYKDSCPGGKAGNGRVELSVMRPESQA